MKALKIDRNTAGTRFALVPVDDTFSVYKECRNYDGRVAGGIRTSWRYCEKGLTREAAEALFARKIKGKVK